MWSESKKSQIEFGLISLSLFSTPITITQSLFPKKCSRDITLYSSIKSYCLEKMKHGFSKIYWIKLLLRCKIFLMKNFLYFSKILWLKKYNEDINIQQKEFFKNKEKFCLVSDCIFIHDTVLLCRVLFNYSLTNSQHTADPVKKTWILSHPIHHLQGLKNNVELPIKVFNSICLAIALLCDILTWPAGVNMADVVDR